MIALYLRAKTNNVFLSRSLENHILDGTFRHIQITVSLEEPGGSPNCSAPHQQELSMP